MSLDADATLRGRLPHASLDDSDSASPVVVEAKGHPLGAAKVSATATATARPSKPARFAQAEPVDADIEDDYVTRTLASQKALPPVTWSNFLSEVNWLSTIILTVTPLLSIYGLFTTKLQAKTFWFAIFWYYVTGLGITAGYHRLWAHRSYTASKPLQYALALAGAGAVQGSIRWWSRGHRAHHRYTDTDLDPYSAHRGLVWSHIGWMVIKPRRKPGVADVSDLTNNAVVRWQHENYLALLLLMGLAVPTLIPGLFWGDWTGGFFFAGAARLCFVHHSTFCVNSLAHWLGEASFDNKISPRDHVITALVTIGEGYHNFHHQFPMDYRNAIKWFQYDPTKWFIATMKYLGLASHLKVFPDNEVKKGQLTMQLKRLHEMKQTIEWPKSSNHLPVVSWDDFQEESKTRPLIVVHGFVHDVSSFLDEHPGGRHLLMNKIGKDATTAFLGGVYDHSNAAHNLLAMMRVGVLDGGYELEANKPQYRAAAAAAHAGRSGSASDATNPGVTTSSDESDDFTSSGPPTPLSSRSEENLVLPAAVSAKAPTSSSSDSASASEDVVILTDGRRIAPSAAKYLPPSQILDIVSRGELTENARARRGKLGKLL